jgi:LysR family cys regulon transcriptional activator
VAAEGLNLSRAARRLNASQPAVTRHLQQLERSLGVALFVRRGRRMTGLTSAGRALLPIVARVLDGVEEMRRIARDLAAGAEGEVTVATIHTHARYVLPPAIERFLRDFPKVRLRVRQGSRAQVAAWVDQGEADFSLASAPKEPFPGPAFHPCYAVHRVVLARPDHALARLVGHRRRLTLEDVARHPVITYDHESEAWGDILDAFERRGLQANVVLSAVDADIIRPTSAPASASASSRTSPTRPRATAISVRSTPGTCSPPRPCISASGAATRSAGMRCTWSACSRRSCATSSKPHRPAAPQETRALPRGNCGDDPTSDLLPDAGHTPGLGRIPGAAT